jgi:Domain of unknown function (DUF4399)
VAAGARAQQLAVADTGVGLSAEQQAKLFEDFTQAADRTPLRRDGARPGALAQARGQTEAQVTLKPGPHTLQLLLGDKDHIRIARRSCCRAFE